MSVDMECFHNYCLFCDKQVSSSETYCSQRCRLGDMEQSDYIHTVSGYSKPSYTKPTTQLQLQPAFNFAAYRHSGSRIESPPVSPRGFSQMQQPYQIPQHQYQMQSTHQYRRSTNTAGTTQQVPHYLYRSNSDYPRTQQHPSLNTSTSRSSLSSISSTSTAQGLAADQAMTQLQNYSNSFDHTRDWKRRTTSS